MPLPSLTTQAAAAAAKSLHSCPTLCDPMDCSPPGSSVHGIFQARVLEWGAIAFSLHMLGSVILSSSIESRHLCLIPDLQIGC